MSDFEALQKPLAGKLALVTGGARGIGLEISKQLAVLGAEVLIAARHKAKADRAAARLCKAGHKAQGLRLDVTFEDDRDAVYRDLLQSYGRLDILINNAAVYRDSKNAGTPAAKRASGTSRSVLRSTFETNFFAPIFLTQTLLPLLRRSTAARIVNLSSIQGSLTYHADPTSPVYSHKAFAYDASKTALNAFTIQLAEELRHTRIKVNSVHPGWVRTKMGSDGADLSVEEGARSAVIYASLPDDGPTGGFFHLHDRLPW